MLKLKAYAKINLSLKILGKRPDGYHEIESIMQSVSLCDCITLSPLSSGIQLSVNDARLPEDRRNLAFRAAEMFFENIERRARDAERGVKIGIEKNIPVAAGLAGGSADAAAVLYGLNQLSINELMELGAQIGSDVPFCLVGGNCTVTGRGENVKRNTSNLTHYYVLVVPDLEISSKWAYEEFDRRGAGKVAAGNDLEPVVMNKYPVVREIKEKLLELGCTSAQMSGSGPAVFGWVKDYSPTEKILSEMKKQYRRCFLVNSVARGIEVMSC